MSARKLPGRFISMTMGSSIGPMVILPLIRIDWMAFSLSRPPRASRLFAITSSTVWAAAGTDSTASSRPGRALRSMGLASLKGNRAKTQTPMVRDTTGKGATSEPAHSPLAHDRITGAQVRPRRGPSCGRNVGWRRWHPPPQEIRLTLSPSRRFEAIDVNEKIAAEAGDVLRRYRKTLYCSLHTTAGYLDQSLAGRMHHHRGRLAQFFDAWHTLFPQQAEYRHDQMELRSELSDEQKEVEPRNADSHLTFIGSGMRNCVTYRNEPLAPVYFIDLDGTNGETRRQRQTTIVAYDEERVVARESFTVPVSHHPIDSVNLADPQAGPRGPGPGPAGRVGPREGAGGHLPRRHRAQRGAHRQRVRDDADAPRPRRGAPGPAEVRGPARPPHDRRPALDPHQDDQLREVRRAPPPQLHDGGAALGPLGLRARHGQAHVGARAAPPALAPGHLPRRPRRGARAVPGSCGASTRAPSSCSGSRPRGRPAPSTSRSSA